MTDTLAPVERTNWALLAWNSTLDRNDVPSAWLYGQDHLWETGHLVSSPAWGGFSSSLPTPHTTLPSPPPSPPHPTPPPSPPPPHPSSLPTPTPPLLPPTHPLVTLHGLKLMHMHLRKNRLKRPKIKQGTTSKVNCILFNRLLSLVLLNKSGLVRAKAGSFTLKTLNGCFSNYYQVRTWPVFAETVTIVMRKVAICAIHGLSCAKSRYLVCAIIHGLRSSCAIHGLIYTLSIRI